MTNGGSALSNVTNLLRVHVCACMCVLYVRMNVCTCACICVCVCVCVRMCVRAYVCGRVRACVTTRHAKQKDTHTHKKSTWQAQTVLFAKQCEFVFIMKQ